MREAGPGRHGISLACAVAGMSGCPDTPGDAVSSRYAAIVGGTVAVVAGVMFVLGSPLAVLTAVGARRRGASAALAVLAGLGYPFTWVVWYLRDERPYTRAVG